MDEIIDEFYEKLNFPSLEKLFKAISAKHKDIKKSDVKLFLDSQNETQVLKVETKTKGIGGHIVALFPNESWQIDYFELLDYGKSNNGYLHIFACIDIFTRKAYAVATKKKDSKSSCDALQKIIDDAGGEPKIIMSDNDSAFKSDDFQELLDKYNIVSDMNVVGDHNALGIIDNFAKRLKMALSKRFIRSKSTNWIDSLQKIVDNYNNQENSAIDDITPNEAHLEENQENIFEINLIKGQMNKTVSDLKEGDHVRIKIKSKFSKGSDAQWSDNVYEVKKVRGGNIELDDDEIKKRGNLLKVVAPLTKTENIIKEAKKDAKVERKLKSEGLVRNDNIESVFEATKGREREKKVIMDL